MLAGSECDMMGERGFGVVSVPTDEIRHAIHMYKEVYKRVLKLCTSAGS
jgi:hypothetical protein